LYTINVGMNESNISSTLSFLFCNASWQLAHLLEVILCHDNWLVRLACNLDVAKKCWKIALSCRNLRQHCVVLIQGLQCLHTMHTSTTSNVYCAMILILGVKDKICSLGLRPLLTWLITTVTIHHSYSTLFTLDSNPIIPNLPLPHPMDYLHGLLNIFFCFSFFLLSYLVCYIWWTKLATRQYLNKSLIDWYCIINGMKLDT